MRYSMEWYWYIWFVFCGCLLVGTIGTLIYRILKKKRYVFFRLLDEKTGRPVAGVQVRGLVVSNSYTPSYATSMGSIPVYAVTKQTSEKYKLLGYTDEQGTFRRKVSFLSYGALWLENENPSVHGLVSRDHVSQEGGFPARPFVCKVAFGMVQPPEHVID